MPPLVALSIAAALPVAGMFAGLLLFGRRGGSVRELARVMAVVEISAIVAAAFLVGVGVANLVAGGAS